ncbi:zinc-dependent metalloprotease [Nocardioides sp. C4-1]|uniref:zinc-dependent metalloprotease n=1 Tax=Nocardioides sp. C4-1 TaxID=3151851 RepID=UPI0032646632
MSLPSSDKPAERPGRPEMVDWDLAVRMASRLAGAGPEVSADEAAAVVAELRAGAERSTGLVREFTGLVAADHTAPVLVVDRPGWIQANADAFRHLTGPIVDQLAEKQKKPPSGLALAVGSRVTGAEVGGLLGFLAGKVLGQFDPFHAPDGRLLLVAPNIVHVEREIDADPTDFRLWVCLHEETHRVQFTAVPWMRDHMFAQVQALSATVSPSGLDELVKRVTDALGNGIGKASIVDLLSTPEQKAILDGMTGMMSLLEGHADVVMDDVGPTVIPSVASIRKSFTQRRKGVGSLDRLLRRLLGLDAKMAQYRDGATFVRAVVDKVGMEEFNVVWERAEHLPSKAELSDPEGWVARVLG